MCAGCAPVVRRAGAGDFARRRRWAGVARSRVKVFALPRALDYIVRRSRDRFARDPAPNETGRVRPAAVRPGRPAFACAGRRPVSPLSHRRGNHRPSRPFARGPAAFGGIRPYCARPFRSHKEIA
ncbi:conserved hypothetical protein [Burkholderia vietnamiensis]|nr:conserved hypothetical protein [Burkholderia vietnamiensis]